MYKHENVATYDDRAFEIFTKNGWVSVTEGRPIKGENMIVYTYIHRDNPSNCP